MSVYDGHWIFRLHRQPLGVPRSILLAEDNEDDVFFFKAAAKKAGWPHDIVVATNGREAIEMLGRFAAGDASGPRLSLVLLDLKMPFVGGLEVLEWARSQAALRFLPMVVLTSSEQETDIATAYRLGAASFLVKPSQSEGLAELVRVLDAYWLHQNRLPAAMLDHEAPRPAAVAS
jgi:CheY-like chemotaxis protein